MAVEIGALRALLSLDSTAFVRGARRAEASMGQMQRRLHRLGQGMRQFGRSMSTRVSLPMAVAAGAAVRSSLTMIDAQAKMAESLDTSVVSIQNLARAGDLAGISQSDLEGSLTRMTRRISLAEQGAGPAAAAFERLGLSAENLNDLPVDERVNRINAAIRRLIPEAEQAAIASQVFGDRSGLAMLRLDPDVLARAAEEVSRFGVAVSEVDADQIEAANDAMSAIGLVTRGLANQLTVALAPTLQRVAERIADLSAWFSNLSPDVRRFIALAGLAAGALGPVVVVVGFMATGLAALASPIGLVVFGLGAIAGAAAYVVTQWDDLAARFPILQRIVDFGARLAKVWSELPGIKWALLIPALRWARFIPGLRWAVFIPNIAWVALAGALRWSLLIPTLSWAALAAIPRIGWVVAAGALRWGTLIARLSWAALRVIPGIGWVALAGSLIWGALINRVEWDGWIPRVQWADWITKIDWLDWIPSVDWERVFRPAEAARAARAAQAGAEVASDFMDGMQSAINSQVGDLGVAAAGIAEYMEDAIREESETQSPSRSWMRIGEDLMAGLNLGVAGGVDAAVQTAQAAAEGVTDVVANTVSGLDYFRDAAKTVFRDVFQGGKSLSDSLRDILGNASSSLFNAGIDGLFAALFPNAMGNAFAGGQVMPFASGGVIDGPTMFKMRGGLGLMGEAGPEAIMPLTRGPDGKLGVRAAGGGGGQAINMPITIDARGADPSVLPRMHQMMGQLRSEIPGLIKGHNANPYVRR